jgi:spore coat protein U-like protein
MKLHRLLRPATLFLLSTLAMPSWGAGSSCFFQAKGGLRIDFAPIDPSGTLPALANAASTNNSNMAGTCNRTMSIRITDGQNPRLLRKGTDTVSYSLALPLSNIANPGNSGYTEFTFSATIAVADYADAPAGTYTDTVNITLEP